MSGFCPSHGGDGVTLTGPAQHLDESQEEEGRQEETYAILKGGPRETWQMEGKRVNFMSSEASPGLHIAPRSYLPPPQ